MDHTTLISRIEIAAELGVQSQTGDRLTGGLASAA
jgi:hypothetical protein